MKIKVFMAFALLTTFYSCKKELQTSSLEKGDNAQGKNILRNNSISRISNETDDFFTTGFKPDASYEMMFTDRFLSSQITHNPADPNITWWTPRTASATIAWQNNYIARNKSANVSVNPAGYGTLDIAFNRDSAGNLYGGGIISKKAFGYGYYEARVKLYTGTYGLHQSFWSFGTAIEIDGFETDSKRYPVLSTLHPGRHRWRPEHIAYLPTSSEMSSFVTVPNTNLTTSPNNSTDTWDDTDGSWVTVGYEWLPGEVKYYVNGVLKNTFSSTTANRQDVYQPANVYLTALPYNPDVKPLSEAIVTPQQGAKMQVEYFAYYAKKIPNANLLGNSSFDYVNDPQLQNIITKEEGVTSWSDQSLTVNGVITYGSASNISPNSYVTKIGTNWVLEQKNSTQAYKAVTRQTLSFIRPGNYKLSADIRCSVAGSKFIVLDKDQTTVLATRTILGPHSTDWINITLDNIPVNNNEVTVLIYSDLPQNQWLQVDDIKFVAKP